MQCVYQPQHLRAHAFDLSTAAGCVAMVAELAETEVQIDVITYCLYGGSILGGSYSSVYPLIGRKRAPPPPEVLVCSLAGMTLSAAR
jgi:hypothetical protein